MTSQLQRGFREVNSDQGWSLEVTRVWCLVEVGLLRDVDRQRMGTMPGFLESATFGGMGRTRFGERL